VLESEQQDRTPKATIAECQRVIKERREGLIALTGAIRYSLVYPIQHILMVEEGHAIPRDDLFRVVDAPEHKVRKQECVEQNSVRRFVTQFYPKSI